jgi:hypothetical protein
MGVGGDTLSSDRAIAGAAGSEKYFCRAIKRFAGKTAE